MCDDNLGVGHLLSSLVPTPREFAIQNKKIKITRSSVSLNLRFDAWPLTNITLYKIVSIQYLFITTHGFHVNKFNTVTYGSTVFK